MSENKKTIEKYIDGFQKSDHKQILSCLTDNVIWEMPGVFRLVGKEAFDGEIENPAFAGSPIIAMERMTEETNVVVLEGKVQGKKAEGTSFAAVFCDVFEMENHKIKQLTSYFAEIK